MDFKDMTIDELIARRSEIAEECEIDGANLDALEAEVRGINEEIENRRTAEEKKAEIRNAVAAGAGTVIETAPTSIEEDSNMSDIEMRNTPEYIDAYAEYIKTGDATECRALLTENVSGTVAVPEFVYDIVKTAWEKEGIMSRVRKAYLRGNLKVGFEISADGAVVHTEGGEAISPENLVLGIVELVPQSIKKVVQISDESYDLRGEAFLRYIYDELTYRIAKKAADELVTKIIACNTVSTTTCPSVQKVTAATVGLGTVAAAMAELSDEAADPVIMMNKKTWGTFKTMAATASYGYDPFEGLPVIFNNTIKAYAAASTGDTYAIVGDLGQGALANFPDGDGIEFKFDNMTLKKQDLIEVLGRQFVGLGVVAPDAFTKIVK